MKIRAAVLEATDGLHHLQELDLAPPGPGEVLVRLAASGVCRSDYNAIDGTTESPCPVVLGPRGRGRRRGDRSRRDPRRRRRPRGALVDAVLRRVRECVRGLPQLCATVWPTMGLAGSDGRHEPALARRRDASTTTASSPPSPRPASSRSGRACPSRATCRSTSRLSSAARSRPGSGRSGRRPACGPATGSR